MNRLAASKKFMGDYDLSHPELATLLNISRSMALMVVSGRRSLPIDAEIRVFELTHLTDENGSCATRAYANDPFGRPICPFRRTVPFHCR